MQRIFLQIQVNLILISYLSENENVYFSRQVKFSTKRRFFLFVKMVRMVNFL